jgi:tetratricopeptide (TPR) repeat protein
MGQVFAALDEAHVHGVIHRDLKPENVMVTNRRGEPDFVKVCDFGIAKIQDPKSDAPESVVTMAGVVCGTPEYMSPEQARGEKLDGRTDLYSAAVILYQMATGELPFTAETALGVVTKHLTDQPVPPRRRRPDVAIDPGLEALILRGLEKDRARRPASALEFKRELEALLEPGRAVAVAPAGVTRPVASAVATAPTLAAGDLGPATADALHEVAPRRRTGVIVGAAVGIALVATAGVLLARGGQRPARAAAPPVAAIVDAAVPSPAAPPPVAVAAPDAASVRVAVAAPAPARPHPARPESKRDVDKPRPEKKTAEPARPPQPEAKAPKPEPKAPAARGFKEILAEAEAALRSGKAGAAVQLLEEARRLSPGNPKVHRLLGKGYNLLGRAREGRAAYQRYLELWPNAPDAEMVRAMIK